MAPLVAWRRMKGKHACIDGRTKRDTSEWRVENSILDNEGTDRVVFGGKKMFN